MTLEYNRNEVDLNNKIIYYWQRDGKVIEKEDLLTIKEIINGLISEHEFNIIHLNRKINQKSEIKKRISGGYSLSKPLNETQKNCYLKKIEKCNSEITFLNEINLNKLLT